MSLPHGGLSGHAFHTQYIRRRGFALIAVLWIGVIAGLLLITLRTTANMDLAGAQNELDAVQARWAARAGVEQAIATLNADDPASDSHLDTWHDDPMTFEQIDLGPASFSVNAPPAREANSTAPTAPRFGVTALAGRLNINEVSGEQLRSLEVLEPRHVAAILDWRDGDSRTRRSGAEGAYYAQLALPYEIADAPFQTRDELRLVKGVDESVFLGEDANRNGMLDPNEDDGRANPPEDDQDGELDPGLDGLVTVHGYERNETALGESRININEAEAQTLQQRLGFTEPLAEAVVEEQDYDDLMELLEVEAEGEGDRDDGNGGDGGDDNGLPGQTLVSEIDLDWLSQNLDQLTRDDDDRLPATLNINLASREALAALPDIEPATVDAIIEYRRSGSGPFETTGELLKAVSDEAFKQLAVHVRVRANVFAVTSVGSTPRGVRRRIVAIVDRDPEPAQVLYWYQSN